MKINFRKIIIIFLCAIIIFSIFSTDFMQTYHAFSRKCTTIENKKIQQIWSDLNEIVNEDKSLMEGSSCHVPGKMDKLYSYMKKEVNHLQIKNIAEIGFNGGHSCAVFLVLFPNAKIKIYDINDHSYMKKCYNYLDKLFPNRLSLVIGDSTKTVPLNKEKIFDFVHVDGGHFKDIPRLDLENTYNYLVKNKAYILFDDTYYYNSFFLNISLIENLYAFNTFLSKFKKVKIIKRFNGSTLTFVDKNQKYFSYY